jgi:hypothetical protein
MSYGELTLPPVNDGVNKINGRFLKGHVPANKGKRWSDYMGKRAQKRAAKGWKNLDLHRNKNGRPDTAVRCRKQVVAVMDDGSWLIFPYVGAAAEWLGCGSRENIGRCCRQNESKKEFHKTNGVKAGRVNTDHRYRGIRFYFESDNVWMNKIKIDG